MNGTKAFWDSSALIPLCAPQAFTPKLQALFKKHDIAVWWGTPVEISSGVARLLRMGQLDAPKWKLAKTRQDELETMFQTVGPSDQVLQSAKTIVERYDLRAGDAFQLAAALEWCDGNPQGRTFLTLDSRLRDAALLCGFDAPKI